MSLPLVDREWTKDMIAAAMTEGIAEMKTYTHKAIGVHARECPNISRAKWLLIGICIALGSGTAGILSGPLAKLIIGK